MQQVSETIRKDNLEKYFFINKISLLLRSNSHIALYYKVAFGRISLQEEGHSLTPKKLKANGKRNYRLGKAPGKRRSS